MAKSSGSEFASARNGFMQWSARQMRRTPLRRTMHEMKPGTRDVQAHGAASLIECALGTEAMSATGFSEFAVSDGDIQHGVFRSGGGPGVVIMHELPGMTKACTD